MILSTGVRKCWGKNDFGQLGLGDDLDRGDGPGEMGNDLAAIDLDGVAPPAPRCDGRDVTVDLAHGGTPTGGADVILGTAAAETINGLGGADRICAGGGADTVNGGGGNDRLFGANGNDRVNGGVGNDNLNGQAGADNLQGGAGADQLNGGTERDTCNGGTQADVQTSCEVRTSIP